MGNGNAKLYPIYTELTECRDCYKCVRACPVKSIQVKEARAVVVRDRCISCGRCVDTCPSHAKKIRNDVEVARELLRSRDQVFVSLAPSYASEFSQTPEAVMVALRKLGFSAISETAIGASLVSAAIDCHMQKDVGRSWISTACPSVVELVYRYHPELIKDLAPIPSPLQCHSAYLRQLYGNDIGIVFIGPCIAKKVEADQSPGFPDVALTFRELRTWFDQEGLDLKAIQEHGITEETVGQLVPAEAGESTLYPVEGGMVATFGIGKDVFQDRAVSVSGVEFVTETLMDLQHAPETESMPFLELLNCEGGCINGPGKANFRSSAVSKAKASQFTKARIKASRPVFIPPASYVQEIVDMGYGLLNIGPYGEHKAQPILPPKQKLLTEEAITKALIDMGKTSLGDELNCGGCGYNSCRDMAVAFLEGMAEPEMCVTKMRKLAQSKIDVLLRTLPMGVVIVDRELRIADCNCAFLSLFADLDSDLGSVAVERVVGLPLHRFVPFHGEFSEQFKNPVKTGQYRLHYKGKYLKVIFFTIENHRLVGAMFQDITTPTIRRETVVKKADAVIKKSLETVQQIASLLGENAAETEITLNSLIDAFQVPDSSSADGFLPDSDQRTQQ
ncbi:[Fe-Fe] hydrogenase large subunit C-terminal domain-containing protein [Pleomorphochaeta sp. DL1XJH-081]|uniref:[Fe-Fe] hydrogenase large subunit C-terminal domain-containing protein n=1 Tax=Pleomorphochaeta sp. DL1XJH-081 TaxID=3409690 RepID=UPI003BB4B2F0